MVGRRRAPKVCISVATLVEVTSPIVRPMRETRRGRINGGGGTPWDGCRLVILRAQASLVQLMLHVVGLRGGFDIHEGHSGGKTSGPVFLLEPWQQLDTLNAPIAFEMFSNPILADILRQIPNPKVTSLSNHLAPNSS